MRVALVPSRVAAFRSVALGLVPVPGEPGFVFALPERD